VDPAQVDGDAVDAVRVDPAQVGVDERVGHRAGVAGGEVEAREEVGDQPAQHRRRDADELAHARGH